MTDAARQQRLVALTRDLMLIPGTEERPEDLERCCAFIANHLDGIPGVSVRRIESHGVVSLLALPDGIESPRVLMSGHADVISHPEGTDLLPRIEDNRIVGPGAGDMKAAVAVMIAVLEDVHRECPGASLGLLITSDEEIGGHHGVRHIFDALGFRCGGVLLPDGGSIDHVTIEEKGLLHLEVHARGHAAHAARPWLGENAIEHLLTGLERVRARFDAFPATDEHWEPTCVVTILDTPNTTHNRLPEHAHASLDLRFPHPYTADEMRSIVADALGEGLELVTHLEAEPADLRPEPAFLDAVEAITGQPPTLVREHGASDGRFMCTHGIPVMMARPRVGALHADDEWVEIESLETLYDIYRRYLDALSDLRP